MKTATDVPPAAGPRPRNLALYAATAAVLLVCGVMLWPFLPGLATGLATAAVCLPAHRRVRRWVGVDRPTLAAAVSTMAAVLVVLVPLAAVSAQLVVEARRGAAVVQEKATDGTARRALDRVPYLGDILAKMDAGEVSVEQEARAAVSRLGQSSLGWAQGAVAAGVQLLIGVFVLYFVLKDHRHLLDGFRRLVPLPDAAAGRLVARMDDAVMATVIGTVLTGVLQGATGGLLFWLLGVPAPVLWGVVMTVFSILPVLGAFLVWAPAAAWLASTGQWWQAGVLVGWGLLMAGPVCNYIYAVTAADRMQLHPVPTLLAFVGGLAVFGVAGLVIGPAVLALAVGLLEEQGADTGEAAP